MEAIANLNTGGCMCGSVRYEVQGEPLWVGHCHCKSCRHHTGGPLVTLVSFDVGQATFTSGERRIYESSPGVARTFCGRCGTSLTWEGMDFHPERGRVIEFHISTFDRPDAYIPTNHLFHDERIAWFDVNDDLPRYRGSDFRGEVDRIGSAPVPHGA